MPSRDEIIYTAERIEDDTDVLRDAVTVLLNRGSSSNSRVVKDLRKRIEEWKEQTATMRARAEDLSSR